MAVILIKVDTIKGTVEELFTTEAALTNMQVLTVDRIITTVCKHFRLSKGALKDKSRGGDIPSARIISACLIKELLGYSNSTIAKAVGYSKNRNSSNVVSYAYTKVIKNEDIKYYSTYLKLKKRLQIQETFNK